MTSVPYASQVELQVGVVYEMRTACEVTVELSEPFIDGRGHL